MVQTIFEGYGEIISAGVLFSLAGIFGKMISGMPVQSIILYRVSFAFIMLFVILLISGNIKKIQLKGKKTYLVLFGILQAATMLAYFESFLNASVSIAVLLLYTAPVYVTVLSPLLLKERSTKNGVIALVLAITGILLIVDLRGLEFSQQSIGILAGIISGITYAFQIMTSKYISKTYSGYTQAFWGFLIASLLLLPVSIVPVDARNTIYILLLSIFPTLLAVSLYFNGLKMVRASNASILGLIEPLSAVILAVLILNEKISIPMVIGGALILTGAVVVTKDERKNL